jgi:hypothetical protein
LGLRELLEELLGPEGRRRLALKSKTNEELFTLYDAELILKVHNTRNLENERRLLTKFHSYLNGSKPSPELAKGFLSQYSSKKPGTLARYAATIKSFMKWYGEPMDNTPLHIFSCRELHVSSKCLFDRLPNGLTGYYINSILSLHLASRRPCW